MNPINTIAELENLINSGTEIVYFSKSFQCGFKIMKCYLETFDSETNEIECYFESGPQMMVRLSSLFSI
jgi:hypothetical protein